MPYSLKDRNVLVTGGSRGLGALLCELFAKEGSNVAINYNSNQDRAEQVKQKVEAESRKAIIIGGDVGKLDDCKHMVQETIKQLGGLDIIISNAGWTKISTFGDLDALNEAEWDKCWAVNTKSNLHLFREALPTFNANPEGGVFLISSSVAGISVSGSAMAYSVTKAAGLHLMQCLAQSQGPKVRVNAICPGLLMTEWGQQFPDDKVKAIEEKSTLKKVVDLEDCAQAYISAAKNSSMTGERIRIDSGLMIR